MRLLNKRVQVTVLRLPREGFGFPASPAAPPILIDFAICWSHFNCLPSPDLGLAYGFAWLSYIFYGFMVMCCFLMFSMLSTDLNRLPSLDPRSSHGYAWFSYGFAMLVFNRLPSPNLRFYHCFLVAKRWEAISRSLPQCSPSCQRSPSEACGFP